MGRFVIKKHHQKDYMLETYWTIQGSIVNTIRKAYVILKEKENPQFDLL
jgi:hypothetical protein